MTNVVLFSVYNLSMNKLCLSRIFLPLQIGWKMLNENSVSLCECLTEPFPAVRQQADFQPISRSGTSSSRGHTGTWGHSCAQAQNQGHVPWQSVSTVSRTRLCRPLTWPMQVSRLYSAPGAVSITVNQQSLGTVHQLHNSS